jgi:L-asparaginase II
MLAVCVYEGWNVKTYLSPRHPVQKMMLKKTAELCEYPIRKIGIGVEACGAPTFALPLRNMALGFSKLKSFVAQNLSTSQSLQVVADSMWRYPDLVSGRGRLDYDLATASKGNILAKAGAEALHCALVVDHGYGVAVKILDGSRRGIAPVAIEVYRQLGILNKRQIKHLTGLAMPYIHDHQGNRVGYLKAEFKLKHKR